METIPPTFLGLDAPHSDYESARFAVLPVPYDGTVSFRTGSRHGPLAVITCSEHLELFDEELEKEFFQAGIATLHPVAPIHAGPEQMHEALFKHARKIVRDGKFLFGLGGEHSVTAALVRAVMTKHKKLSVLQIDAHADLRDEYQGTRFSHGCVMRRVHEMGTNLVPVGIRAFSKEEHRFMRKAGIEPITARQCHEDEDWLDCALDALGDAVYVTVDIDGFDPAYAPGTGTPEPGGLDWYQVIGLLRLVAAEKRIVGADVVEVVPIVGEATTEFLAARVAYKIMSYVCAEE
jgi:agmatinase